MSASPNLSFEDWLHEPIHWKGGTILPRWRVLHWFVHEGLVPWVQSHGYRWGCNHTYLANCIATGLYDNHRTCHLESEWRYPGKNTHPFQEEEAHFHFVLSQEEWDAFWSMFGTWGDVALDTFRGHDRRLDIQNFVWGQLDLEASPQTRQFYELFMSGDDEPEQPSPAVSRVPQRDMYLQEAVEYNGWGGYRR